MWEVEGHSSKMQKGILSVYLFLFVGSSFSPVIFWQNMNSSTIEAKGAVGLQADENWLLIKVHLKCCQPAQPFFVLLRELHTISI